MNEFLIAARAAFHNLMMAMTTPVSAGFVPCWIRISQTSGKRPEKRWRGR